MLSFLQGKAGDRKLRLFVCACCRRVDHLIPDRRCRKALEASERYADGIITEDQLEWADRKTWQLFRQGGHGRNLSAESNLVGHKTAVMMQSASKADLGYYLAGIMRDFVQLMEATGDASELETEHWLSDLLRCATGNPFRPVSINPDWRTLDVLKLAQAIYQERTFDQMPMLGEALEEAGCDTADILAHCRAMTEHVRGCWVVDAILGKS